MTDPHSSLRLFIAVKAASRPLTSEFASFSMQRITKPLSFHAVCRSTSTTTAASSTVQFSTGQQLPEAIRRARAARASSRGGCRGVSRRHPLTEERTHARVRHHGRAGWSSRQPRTGDQANAAARLNAAGATQISKPPSAPTAQEEAMKQANVEGVAHGRFGRFSSHRPLMADEQMRAFAAIRGEGHRTGMERAPPYMNSSLKKDWTQQRKSYRDALRAALLAPPLREQQGAQERAQDAPLLRGREWFARSGHNSGRHRYARR